MFKTKLKQVRKDINNYRLKLMGGIVRFDESSAIKSVAYDRTSNVLEVIYIKGGVYNYKNVEPAVFHRFLRAESKGKFLHEHIRNDYKFDRIV